MPDGTLPVVQRGFERLTLAGLDEFRRSAKGDLRARLNQVADAIVSEPDGWLYRRDGAVRGIGALSEMTPWIWRLWSFPGELNLADWKAIIRFTRLRIENRFADASVLRIEATARADVAGARELLERLGFQLEGFMQCYGPGGEAHWLYAVARPPAAAFAEAADG